MAEDPKPDYPSRTMIMLTLVTVAVIGIILWYSVNWEVDRQIREFKQSSSASQQ